MTKRPAIEIAGRRSVDLRYVGWIALAGFVIGVAWPRLAGVSLVPAAPVEGAARSAPAPSGSAAEAEPTVDAAPVEEEETSPLERLHVGDALITSCVDDAGKSHQDCGELDTDAFAHAPLLALAACPAAEGAFGKLSIGFVANFDEGKITNVTSGNSTTLPEAPKKALLECAREEFASVKLGGKKPAFSKYTIYYILELAPPGAAADKDEIVAASGRATVRWRAALIRRDADRDAPVRARLMSGTRVVVTGRHGKWYRVKYDAKGREGWVHGAAIGLKPDDEDSAAESE